MAGVVGIINDVVTVVVSEFQEFAENVVAAGASILNNFLNVLAGPAAHDKEINEFSTQNSYFFTDDAYIDNLHNTDRIALNSLIKGTSFTDEIIDFYRKINSSYDFDLWKAIDLQRGESGAGTVGTPGPQGMFYYTPYNPQIECNYDLGPGDDWLDDVLSPVTLRINNTNLYEGTAPAAEYAGNNGQEGDFTWHTVLEDDNGMQGAAGYYNYSYTLNAARLAYVQENTKNYLKYLGIPDPENLLDDLPYTTGTGAPGGATYSDVIDSAFLNFRVKFVSGIGSETGNRISNKYLWLLAEAFYDLNSFPHTLTYTTDNNEVETVHLFKYEVVGDGSNYSLGISHITTSTYTNQDTNPHADYLYDKELISSDGYYYYDADKNLLGTDGYFSANTVAEVQTYLDTDLGSTPYEEYVGNWLEIDQNSVTVTIAGVDSVFPDEIYLTGSSITLTMISHTVPEVPAIPGYYAWTAQGAAHGSNAYHYGAYAGKPYNGPMTPGDGTVPSFYWYYVATVPAVPAYDVWIDAADQVLRVGNLYIKKSTTEIMFATVPASEYSDASITYGKSNTTGVTYYTIHNVSAIERVTDYAGEDEDQDTTFRYISHKLDASNNCVSAPVIMGILDGLDPFERHKLVIASANLSLHLGYYLRIPATLQQKLLAAVLNVISIAVIVYTVITLGSAGSFAALAETAIVAYATSLAINVAIEQILVPIIVSNFGEDEALVVLAIAAVAIAYYSRKSSTTGLNQFPNQVALFTTSIDIMNQMYTLAVVQPGIIEMQKEQDEWTATDSELTEKEEVYQEEYDALFGTEDSPSHLLNLQIRAALNPMPASAYFNYHDTILERQFDCFDYDKYNELNVS